MRALLVTAGSRGDVEPFLALAEHMVATGHTVRVVAPDNSGVGPGSVDVVSLGVDYSRLIETQGVSPIAALRNYGTVVKPTMRAVLVGAARAAQDFRPDVLVYHPKILSAPLIADALGIPHVTAELVPAMTPTRAFPAAGTITANLGPLNRLTYSAATAAGRMFGAELDAAAATMGRARHKHDSAPSATLMPVSPTLLARPDDWPDTLHLTGPWLRASAAAADGPAGDEELEAFTDRGPFIYAGFGSMAAGDPQARARSIIEAARERGMRVLLVTGLGGLAVPDELRGDDVLVRRTVDHDAVLPLARVAIHHGGIGTVHAALRAGTVSVVVPFIADQPFWGAVLHRRGLGPPPIRQRRLRTARLTALIAEAPAYDQVATTAAAAMSTEDGAGAALRVLEKLP